jgi:hypothetical protein
MQTHTCKLKVVPVLNEAPRHEDLLGGVEVKNVRYPLDRVAQMDI